MSGYEKAMKWSKTHRKGISNLYMGFDNGIKHEEPHFTKEEEKELEKISLNRILNNKELIYPIYIARSQNYYYTTNEHDFLGTKIESYEQLNQFYKDYVE